MSSCECNEDLFQKCHICDPVNTPVSKGFVTSCVKCKLFLCDCKQENKLSGGVSNWYTLSVMSTQDADNYTAVCDDIILALGMTFQEGEVFKATWRKAAARMGNGKPGNTALYNAQKITHYGKIMELEEIHLINKGNK